MAVVRASRHSRTSLIIRIGFDVTDCIFGGYIPELIETVDEQMGAVNRSVGQIDAFFCCFLSVSWIVAANSCGHMAI